MAEPELKFLVDVGVGKKVEDYLIQNDYNIKSIRNLNPSMSDIEILKIANNEDRMVITMDKDFGELVYNSKKSHTGVLLLRLESATGNKKVKIVNSILNKFSNKLYHSFCVFQNNKIRIRKKQ